jgi:hypothetical protein
MQVQTIEKGENTHEKRVQAAADNWIVCGSVF